MRGHRLAWRAAVALLAALGLAVSLVSCGPDASGSASRIAPAVSSGDRDDSPVPDRTRQAAVPEPAAAAVAVKPADVHPSPTPHPTAAPQPTPTPYVERHPFGTACSAGERWVHEPWLFREFVQWTPDGSTILFTDGPQIYAVAANGSRLWQVVKQPAPVGPHSVGSIAPFTIAPDGEHIVYATCAHPKPQAAAERENADRQLEPEDFEFELGRARIDGTDHQRLTVNDRFDNHPSWSPDGRRIAYLSQDDRYRGQGSLNPTFLRLYTMAPDGSDIARVRDGAVNVRLPPQWSPDGKRVAYVRRDAEFAMWLSTIDIDGGALRRLTITVSGPSWSPDGQRIAFAKADGEEVALYTIAADGSDSQRLTAITGWYPEYGEPDPTRAWIETVAWSPDGSKILYSCDRICVVTLDGTPVRQPTRPEDPAELIAAWAPNGSRIATVNFGGPHPNHSHGPFVSTMAPDGSDVQVLVTLGAAGFPVAAQSGYEDVGASQAACAAGFVVDVPADNPGLVRDCEVLLELRDAFFGSAPVNWGPGRPIAQWVGVSVDGAPPRVTGLTLETGGPLSATLAQLSQLRTLHIDGFRSHVEGFTGPIPPELGQLANLQVLELFSPRFTGPIPPELGNLAQLRQLGVGGNQLTGGIPPELGNLAQLQELSVGGNQLTGGIPPELGNLAQLQELSVGGNQLTGGIPPELGKLVQLRELSVVGDQLTGGIPPELGNLAQLEYLAIVGTSVTGPIPTALSQLASLERLHLRDNQLTGTVPPALGQLPNLDVLILWGNRLTGCIPVGLQQVRRTDVADLGLPACAPA